MSEPTNDGNQHSDPEQQPNADADQTAGSEFSDPTAPVWADPTAPIAATPTAEVPTASVQDTPDVPPTPPSAPGAASPYGQQPASPYGQQQPTPPVAPPLSNPYAQQPPAQPAGQYGQPGQPQPQPGQPYPAYGQQPYYATGAPASNTSAIVLTIVSGLSTLMTCFIGIPSLVFGIMALTSNATDPVGSRKKARTGWIIYGINAGVAVLAFIALIVILVVTSNGHRSTFDSGY